MRHRRIALGVAASIFDKLVIALVQLLSVPTLATAWGIDIYGGWVLLSTIPSFLSVSDFGFAGAAGTRMTMLVALEDRKGAVVVFQSAWAVILLTSLLMIVLAIVAAWIAPVSMLPSAVAFETREVRVTLSLLLLYGIVSLQGSILTAALRCAGLFAVGMFWAGAAILLENSLALIVVLAGGRPAHAAATLLFCRSLSLLVQHRIVRRMVPWLVLGLSETRRSEARSLLAPALAITALPLAQASFLQGTAIALGIAVSPAAVPAFTATRTLSRVGLQFTQLLNNALMPEYSVAVARGDGRAQAMMLALTLLSSAVVVIPFALMFVLFGPQLVSVWTHGLIQPSHALMNAMAVTVVLGGIWNPLSNLILAMNRHAGYSYPYMVLSLATVPSTYVLGKWWGATGAAISMALLDGCMCVVIAIIGRKLFVSPQEVMRSGCVMAKSILKRVRPLFLTQGMR